MVQSQLQVYKFEDSDIRATADENGNPLFVGRDVALALGYATPQKAIRDHCKGVPKWNTLQTEGGPQRVRMISEGDMYRLIAGSKLPSAQKFESWIFDEVIPQIRRTGGYIPKAETPEETMARAVLIAQKTIQQQKAQIEADRPFTVFGRALSVTDDDIQVGQLAKILRQNGYETGPNLLFKQWLREKVIYRKRTTTNNYEYWPMQACLNAGWFKMKGHSWIGSDGKHESFTLTVTPRGQRHFLNKYLRAMPAMIGKEAL